MRPQLTASPPTKRTLIDARVSTVIYSGQLLLDDLSGARAR
jgi:hypothetical protein